MRDYFLIWEPTDIVGGDFFWFHRTDRGYFIIVGDCTGHGVPGRLHDAHRLRAARPALARAWSSHRRASCSSCSIATCKTMLGQDQGREGETDDGFDAGVCFVSNEERKLVFAGAHFSLWRARHGA